MNNRITQDAAIGAAIVFARDLRGMTRQELAAEIEVSERTLGSIERGERRAKAHERMGIAHVLNVPLGWLENPPVPETVAIWDGDGPDPEDAAASLRDSGAYVNDVTALFTGRHLKAVS